MNEKEKVLLKEYFSLCPGGVCNINLLTEEEKRLKDNGFTLLTGKMQEAEVLNGNQRRYPRKVLEKEMERYQQLINENRAYGELDHSDQSVVELKNASHLVIRTWWDGNKVMGVIKLLKTPSGQIAEGIINSGGQIGISSRALGSLTESPRGAVVNDDLSIISYDLVGEPSCPNAYLFIKEKKENKTILSGQERIIRIKNRLNEILEKKR